MLLAERSFASVAIHWPTPNYTHPHTRGPELYIVNSIFLFIATFCVVTRLYTRISIRNWFGLDDVFISVALIAAIGVYVCVFLGVHKHDWDRHIYDVPFNKYKGMGKVLYASRILWSIASTSARFSVCSLYYRLLDHSGLRKYRWVLHMNSVFMLVLFLSQEMTCILQCLPIKAVWTWPVIADSKCLNNAISLLVQASLNTISEFLVACFPIPIVVRLNMPRSQRFAILGLLSLGFLVAACGSVRTYYLWLIWLDYDFTWWAVPHWIVSEVEIDTSMICACVPVLKPLFDRLRRGGWAAARKPNINENSHSRSDRTSRARSLFAEKLSRDSNLFNSFGTLRIYQTLDLEGIANDGFGYTVAITGPEKEKKKRNKLAKQPSERSLRSAAERQRPLPQSKFGMSDSTIMTPQPPQPSRTNSPSFRPERDNEYLNTRYRSGIEIMEKKEFNLRASYEDGVERNWDVRGQYFPRRKEEETEKGIYSVEGKEKPSLYAESLTTDDDIQIPNRVVNAWQPIPTDAFGCRIFSSRAVTPSGGNSNRAHLPRRNVSPQRANPAVIVTRNNSTIASGSNSPTSTSARNKSTTGPTRMDSQKKNTLPCALHATRMNTPSPPLGQPPRTKSPIVAPNNSSQPWASISFNSHIQQLSNLQLNNLSDEALTAFTRKKEEQTRPDTLDLAIAGAWREPGSHNSSLSVMDGSRESLVLKLDTIADGDKDQGYASESGSFDLPVQRPGAERSGSQGALKTGSRPTSVLRPNSAIDSSTFGRVYSRGNPTGLIPITWIGSRPGTADL